jgi:S1-C subfamily serine protease
VDSRQRHRSGSLFVISVVAFVSALGGIVAARWLPIGEQATGPTPATGLLERSGHGSLSPLVKRTAPAVVNIAVLQPSPAVQNPLLRDPYFRRYFGVPDEALAPTIAAGSGVILDAKRGLVVTNFHVVRHASAIEVALQDKRTFPARLIGADPQADLAVLHIDGRDLPSLPLGNSSDVAVGDYVVAIGNPFALGQTVTEGIVSATDRSLESNRARRFIQTDAPINPGNSGGPLIDMNGKVIGINSALFSPNEGNVGIGFAIPADTVRAVLQNAVGANR